MLALRTKMTDSALEVFQLYANLLTEEARQPWDLIVKEQTESSPFHDIFGRKEEVTGQGVRVIQEVPVTPPPIVFRTWRRQKFEILYFKLPQEAQQGSGASVCAARDAAEQLRGRPPVLVLQPGASTMTQQVYSFTDAELACHILRMCPLKWQDQYHLLEKCYPEGVKPLLLILERIEVAHPVDERQSSSKPAKAQGAEQPSKKFALGARIPKKPKQARTEYTRVDKNCELCKSMGRTHHA
eukprot:CCRYP_010479-RA/>CCRYP_010479-RA protein AED:0.25 eAED:0.25 QI:0/-1/0/1/-1/1/1/0/240